LKHYMRFFTLDASPTVVPQRGPVDSRSSPNRQPSRPPQQAPRKAFAQSMGAPDEAEFTRF
ncbi:methyl-accepting chemotaxis protein, partial [Pseudomonas syringae pv. tagetis]